MVRELLMVSGSRFAVIGVLMTGLLLAPLAVTPASAAPAAAAAEGTCRVGVVLPARLVLTGYATKYGARLTGDLDCFTYATWDLSEGLISTGQTISFYRPDTSGFVSYVGTPARVHALPRQGAYSLVTYTDPVGVLQKYSVVEAGSGVMTAKYDSRIGWRPAKHVTGGVRLKVKVASISDATRVFGTYAAWAGAKVRSQQWRAGKWHTVTVARTDATGTARATVTARAGKWRAVTADTGTTWGRHTGNHTL